MGGGACYLQSKKLSNGCRKDDRNLTAEAYKNGFKTVIDTSADFAKLTGNVDQLPLVALLSPKDMSYSID